MSRWLYVAVVKIRSLLHVREVEHLEPHVIALDAETVKFCRGMEVSVEQADTEGLKKSMKATARSFARRKRTPALYATPYASPWVCPHLGHHPGQACAGK